MNDNEKLLLNKKHTDTVIEQIMTRPKEKLEVRVNRHLDTFSFFPLFKIIGSQHWLLAVKTFEVCGFVFNLTVENNSFSACVPSHWSFEQAEKTINKLNEILEVQKVDPKLL